MGTRYTFKCPNCSYSALASGGPDIGFSVLTATTQCRTCKKLRDVIISKNPFKDTLHEPGLPLRPDFKMPRLRCPKCRKGLDLWTYPGPCPRCGTIMEKAKYGETCMWD